MDGTAGSVADTMGSVAAVIVSCQDADILVTWMSGSFDKNTIVAAVELTLDYMDPEGAADYCRRGDRRD